MTIENTDVVLSLAFSVLPGHLCWKGLPAGSCGVAPGDQSRELPTATPGASTMAPEDPALRPRFPRGMTQVPLSCRSDNQPAAYNLGLDEASAALSGSSSLEWLIERGTFQIGFSFWGVGAPHPTGMRVLSQPRASSWGLKPHESCARYHGNRR